MSRRFLISALAALVCLHLFGQEKEKIVFTPQWMAQAQFAGYYVAQEKGFYADEGLDVKIVHHNGTRAPEDRITANPDVITTLTLPQAMELADKGIQLVNILQTSMNSGLLIVSRFGGDPLQMKGATLAVWRSGYNQLAYCVAKDLGLDYKFVEAADVVNIFVAGAVDAALAMHYNELLHIRESGIEPDEKSVFRFSEHGYNVQEDGLYVTREFYEKHSDSAERFARASRRGWEYAAEHQDEALDMVMGYVKKNNIATNRIIQDLMLQEVLQLQLDPDSGKREFRLREDMFNLACEVMLRCGLLSAPLTFNQLCR